MKAARVLREKIESERVTVGALATFHFWPGLVECAMRAGLDYLIIDLEHLTHDQEAVATGCAMGRLADFPVLIRPPAAEMTRLRLAMDLGPCGLLVPYVESLETMAVIESAVRMPPRGKRRPGGMGNYWVSDVNYATWRDEVEEDFIVLPQIESRRGLEAVDEIAAHKLTTAIAIGPYDLSADLGVCWDGDAPELAAAKQRIREAGRKAGKNMWMIGDGATLVREGFTFLCVGEPVMAMEGALRQAGAAARGDVTAQAIGQREPLP
ncbi:MAG: HpcH/HpaI aldolase family protein [Phycisphaeraceae bacterium]